MKIVGACVSYAPSGSRQAIRWKLGRTTMILRRPQCAVSRSRLNSMEPRDPRYGLRLQHGFTDVFEAIKDTRKIGLIMYDQLLQPIEGSYNRSCYHLLAGG